MLESREEFTVLSYEQILHEAETLPREQQLLLIEQLVTHVRTNIGQSRPSQAQPQWEDYAGSAPYPLCGEDAQDWVSRTRQESDQGRSVA